ncbi:MAG: F0F1 ATP synthase subunit alpha [Candidatus Moranbacteria bacterium]|nr:F0F1 ATP synthase subunit alpha [Candidatus Moranbacteria bacterium]
MNTKEQILDILKKEIKSFHAETEVQKIGRVIEVGDGIALISGLDEVMVAEMVEIGENKIQGVVLNLKEDNVGVVVLGDTKSIKEGEIVRSTGKILSVPVSEEIVSRVVDPLGRPLDGGKMFKARKNYPLEKIAPRVIERKSVDTPLETGIKSIDLMIPIGRGQRELIIGDRQTGKTAIAIDTIINQKGKKVVCIYVAIGQKKSKVAKIVSKLREMGAMEHTVVVLAGSSDPAALSFLAPYAGCAIGEYFMDKGKDVLIIYDDLSKHAWAYRQVSLLLRRPPGREAYPGDIFYLHSRLLERAAKMNAENGGGSLTALPIVETQAGDVTAYIPTNIISITDGQIYLESELFHQGIKPALNIGLSVSRVGSAAQTKATKKVAGKMRLDLAQFRELAAFVQFASDLDEGTRNQIDRGKRLVEILKQGQYEPLSMPLQVAVVLAVNEGFFDRVPLDKVKEAEKTLYFYLKKSAGSLLKEIQRNGDLENKTSSELAAKIGSHLKKYYIKEKEEKEEKE